MTPLDSFTMSRRTLAVAAASALLLAGCGRTDAPAAGTTKDSGSPIVIVGSFAQSGPLAVTGTLGKGVAAHFDKIAAGGGINGRKVTFIQYDDGYDPSRLAANARRAVEQDKATIFLSFGGPSLSVRQYLNQNKVLHVVFAGNTPFSQVQQFPYTHAWWPDLGWESAIGAAYLKKENPSVKIGVLGFNNDLTDSQAAGLEAGGVKPALVLKVPPTQQDTTSQVTQLKAAGVDAVMLSVGNAQIIGTVKYMNQIGFRPKTFVYSSAAGRLSTIAPLAGAAKGLYSTLWLADPADPSRQQDADLATYRDDVAKYGQGADANDVLVLNGYALATALGNVISSAEGSDAEAYNTAWNAIKGLKVPGLLGPASAGPGGRLVYSYQVTQYDGNTWVPAGGVQDATSLGYAK